MLEKQKIFDCFMFNGENIVLDIRLNILDKYVDYFVIVESNYNFSGKKKKKLFNIENFRKFKNKIIYFIVNDLPKKTDHFYYNNRWWHKNHVRDQYQRNKILEAINTAKPNDIIIISDIDEIPNFKKINIKKIDKLVVCEQKYFKYKINLFSGVMSPWGGSRIIKKKYLNNVQKIRNTYVKKIKFWQFYRHFTNPKTIKNCGWHFHWIQKPNEILNSIKSYAHGEYNKKHFKNIYHIKKKLKLQEDIFSGEKLFKSKIDATFPDYIIKNKKKFKQFIA